MEGMAERFFRPMWYKIQEVLAEGIASGELIQADPHQIHYAAQGANVFYFLSAPLVRLAFGIEPLSRSELEQRRKKAIEFIGQAIFMDRERGARIASRVLAATPMPEAGGITQLSKNNGAIKTDEVRYK
jgi:TetR/AcrR family transcriptional regulator